VTIFIPATGIKNHSQRLVDNDPAIASYPLDLGLLPRRHDNVRDRLSTLMRNWRRTAMGLRLLNGARQEIVNLGQRVKSHPCAFFVPVDKGIATFPALALRKM